MQESAGFNHVRQPKRDQDRGNDGRYDAIAIVMRPVWGGQPKKKDASRAY